MIKDDIVNAVRAKTGRTHRDAAIAVETVLNVVRKTLITGEEVKVSGFGKWVVRDKSARPGRNPHTGERLMVAARRVVRFRVSQALRQRLNR